MAPCTKPDYLKRLGIVRVMLVNPLTRTTHLTIAPLFYLAITDGVVSRIMSQIALWMFFSPAFGVGL